MSRWMGRVVAAIAGLVIVAAGVAPAAASSSTTNRGRVVHTKRRPVKPAPVKRRAACVKSATDYAYGAAPMEVLTATTLDCRTSGYAVILLHGGSWINGDRSSVATAAAEFYARGWQVFNVEYRRGPLVTWDQQGADLRAAYAWVTAPAQLAAFHIDVSRLTVYGESAGGQMAAWLGYQVPVGTIVSSHGVLQPARVCDDAAGARPDTEPSTTYMVALCTRETQMMGCQWSDSTPACRARWDGFSPQNEITSSGPPIYMAEGTADPVVPVPTPDAFAYWCAVAGSSATVTHPVGVGHSSVDIFDGGSREQAMFSWVVAQDGPAS